ncbi:MAG: hypothetical protein KBF82_00985 [Chitinophagaceae bacterium]|nr:hypothetical protein [Chitinophagaceae bacterium]
MKQPFSSPGFLWILLALICLIIILTGLNSVLKRTGWDKPRKNKLLFFSFFFIACWVALLTVLSQKGFFTDFSKLPPRPAFAILIPLPLILLITFSKTGTKIIKLVPSHWFVFMQSFRIFVEVLIWLAFLSNILPVQMSFEGRNFDIISGILALPVGYFLLKRKNFSPKLAIAFNIIGIVLLLNILIVAVLSMPTSFRYFMNEPSNSLVATFPFILLPGVLVPIAYSMHIFSLRQLLLKK